MQRRFPPHPHSAHRGQVIILFAVSSLILVGALALAVDVGFLLAERRQVQAAADAGALAAAHAKLLHLSDAQMEDAAQDYGAENASVAEDEVEVHRPPTSGRFAGDNDYVQVTITKDIQRFFLGAVYDGDWEVSASAVAVVEPDGVNVALLALNSDSGGIETSGNSHFRVYDGSVVSNYNIDVSGNTSIIADEHVNANDGFDTSGNWTIRGDQGTNPEAAEVPDPLADKISPPPLPAAPSNPVSSVNPPPVECYTATPSNPAQPGTYDGGSSCLRVTNQSSLFVIQSGQYRFDDGAGLGISNSRVRIDGGTWNFDGGGISVSGNSPFFEMESGDYSFLDGAGIDVGGNAPDNVLGGGTFYFSGGGGIDVSGNNRLTLNPGTYVFDGGPGLKASGNNRLHFEAGNYEMWFVGGADLSWSGNAYITTDPGAYVKMYFYGGDMTLQGNTNFSIPSGEYYFDNGNFEKSGNTRIAGTDVFFYFTNGGHLDSTGNSSFAFTAPSDTIYSGYYPGVFMYSDASNTATFKWTGNTGAMSRGTIYLPSSKVQTSGNSSGVVLQGQFIAHSFETSGNTTMGVQFEEYVQTAIPNVYLVD